MKYLNRRVVSGSGKTAVLLVNLGTPDAPTTSAVRKYLREFLWDPRLIEFSRVIWWFILNFIVLMVRPRRSARAYRSVWTEDGSPLLLTSQRLTAAIRRQLQAEFPDLEVELAMRYGSPSIAQVMADLNDRGIERLIVLPLYPQYSATSSGSVMDAVMQSLQSWRAVPDVQMIRDYCVDGDYIQALGDSIRTHIAEHGNPDRFVLSFHGIPKVYADRGDPYRLQCEQTAAALAQHMGWQAEQWQLTFQSRFGREEWLQPYTDRTLAGLPAQGVKHLAVMCPGFSVDCLETLEEIDEENREIFLENGGESFHYIPALNDTDVHVNCLSTLVKSRLAVFNR